MLFQTFDEKKDCFMVFRDERFSKHITSECTKTWSYATYLKEQDIDYANLFNSGKSLEEACSDDQKRELEQAQARIKAVLKSAASSGLDLKDVCMYDLIPEHMLRTWAQVKNNICNYVFENNPKPENYDLLLKVEKMITEIKFQPLEIDPEEIVITNVQDKNTYETLEQCDRFISYDQFKTKTGRLSTKKNSFPVMTLAKKYRNVLKPDNDWLFEIDFNACELRVALALLGEAQPEEDLHDWNLHNVFVRSKDRENAKKRIFSWLYNPKSSEDRVGKIYDRDKLKTLHFMKDRVKTVFGREIQCDEDHAVSYIIQSTAADLLFEQMYKVWEMLDGSKSFIKFCNHDSVIIDFSEKDQFMINDIKHAFSQTRFGKFKVNCSAGRNWLDMQKAFIN